MPELGRARQGHGQVRLRQTQLQKPATLGAMTVREKLELEVKDTREAIAPAYRATTPRQQALWKAVQSAKVPGISLGGIARELGISRNTVNKYAHALGPTRGPAGKGTPQTMDPNLLSLALLPSN